jgi:uncharacterized heparinase superfamily protein
MPVVVSLETCSVATVPSFSTTQLATPFVHKLLGSLLISGRRQLLEARREDGGSSCQRWHVF